MIEQKIIIEESGKSSGDLEFKLNELLRKNYSEWKVKQISLTSQNYHFCAAVLIERKFVKKKEDV